MYPPSSQSNPLPLPLAAPSLSVPVTLPTPVALPIVEPPIVEPIVVNASIARFLEEFAELEKISGRDHCFFRARACTKAAVAIRNLPDSLVYGSDLSKGETKVVCPYISYVRVL
jgi:hypothetical protein